VSSVHFIVLITLWIFSVFLVASLFAEIKSLFLHFIGLSSHGRFVSGELGCLEYYTVNRIGHTVLNVDDITDMQEVMMDCLDFTIAKYTANILFVRFSA